MKKLNLVLILILGFFPLLYSQETVKQTTALKIDETITIDGVLTESGWGTAPEATNFTQLEPQKGEPAQFRTVVKILYDKSFIYVGFICYDDEPLKIAAQLTKRDSDLQPDDSVFVMLDTFHDKRNCYFFGTNLLGTQFDGRFIENGRTQDSTWDGIWKSAAQRTDFGWTAEIAIALSSLKFNPGEDRSWGFNLARVVPRKLEGAFWSGPLETPYKVSQYGDLVGLDLVRTEKKTVVIPSIVSKVEEGKESEFDAGVDIRYAFSQAVSGNLTINPDFATVEADAEQINLTRYELRLPEKRNFFLEGSEIYQQRIRLFYSRRISDIYGGAKLYGKAGGYEFSVLTAQTKKLEELGEDSANFTVFRLKKDVMKSSNVGFILANKLVNGKNMGTVGLDTALYFSDTFKFTGQFAASYGEKNTNNLAFFLRPSYDSSTFHIHLRYTHLGENFADNANEVGFISDDNRHELDSAIEKTFWIKKYGIDRIMYESNYNIYWGVDSTLRSWRIDEELGIDLTNKFSFQVEHKQEFKLFEKKFRNNQTKFELGYNKREWQSAEIAYSFGHNYDLDFQLWEASLNYKLTKDFSLSYDLEYIKFDPDPEEESTWIHIIRATNYFTNDLFIKVFYQLNSSIDKKNIQIIFVYRFQPPFGFLQLVYQKGTARFGQRGNQGHTLFLKLTYMF
ncbi:DUF5916 domain-containing protein [Acidobacteriota bacterium]